jgi:hypothetical protein
MKKNVFKFNIDISFSYSFNESSCQPQCSYMTVFEIGRWTAARQKDRQTGREAGRLAGKQVSR